MRERDKAVERHGRVGRERDAVARERDAALEQRDRATRERDAAEAERNRIAAERDAALQERDRCAGERDAAVEQREEAREQIRLAADAAARQLDLGTQPAATAEVDVNEAPPTERRPAIVGEDSHSRASRGAAQASTHALMTRAPERRPRRPPAPTEAGPRHRAAIEPGPHQRVIGEGEDADVWRARLIAIAALLLVLTAFVVLLVAK
jgi:hypothetical protein